MSAEIEHAKNPNLFNTRSALRPLTKDETMRRTKAICAQKAPASPSCTGQIFIGLFFDGTGNNEQEDYIDRTNFPTKQKHSNVVRLYHAYKVDNPAEIKKSQTPNRHYAGYVPGVGTPFPAIGDSGGVSGTAVSWNGEDRIIWGILSVLNFMGDYVSGKDLITQGEAKKISNDLGGIGVDSKKRNSELRKWTETLKAKIEGRSKNTPMPEQVNLSVFGFSRGAAEARAFVNWFFEFCDKTGENYSLAGVPVNIGFLGIFDTVASVGIAGGFSSGMLAAEGHQSWASYNMQIHPAVESCLHLVAAHDVRATFPVDSVRIGAKYPPNVTEYVYPGSHSDVGGGYEPGAQGKTDEIARIPGFEMYCAALAAGVPLMSLEEMPARVRAALLPKQRAVDVFNAYYSKANIKEGPVEDMMRKHMAHYFTYRYQARKASGTHPQAGVYYTRKFFKTAPTEQRYLRDSQQRFLSVVANVVKMIEHLMKYESNYDVFLPQPFQVMATGSTAVEQMLSWQLPPVKMLKYQHILGKRVTAVSDPNGGEADAKAQEIVGKIEQWRRWLDDHVSPVLVDQDAPERDILSVVQSLSDQPQPMEMVEFFDNWVHDSMAGLHQDNMDEFLLNGIGLAKFRRVYFGDSADYMIKQAAALANQAKLNAAKSKRRELKQSALESAEFARTR